MNVIFTKRIIVTLLLALFSVSFPLPQMTRQEKNL